MRMQPVLVKSIQQKDNHHFTIVWSDGLVKNYRLSDLQSHCPCARCYDVNTGKQIVENISKDVRAKKIVNVGRYALRIQFTQGCSTGIYSFKMLRNMGE